MKRALVAGVTGEDGSYLAKSLLQKGYEVHGIKRRSSLFNTQRIDPRYFRPAAVEILLGDPTKAREKLGWVPEITAQEMCAEMVVEDLKSAKRHALLKQYNLEIPMASEI